MQYQLIKLSKEKKFSSNIISEEPWKYSTNEDLRYLFWMSALQKWLREVHNIFVFVSGHSKIWQFYIVAYPPELGVPVNLANFDLEFKKKYLDTFIAYESYESALEVGLYEALQLIK